MRNLVIGVVAALAFALIAADASLFGIAAWKVVLGVIGLWLFVVAGRRTSEPPRR